MPVNLSSLFSAVNEVSPVNNKEAQSAENAGNTSGAQNISGTIQKTADEAGIAMLKNMLKGDTFSGQIINVSDGNALLQLTNGSLINAKLAESAKGLANGQIQTFIVDGQSSDGITVKLLGTKQQENVIISKALEAEGLDNNEENAGLVKTLLSLNMPIDAKTLGELAKTVLEFPDTSDATIANLMRLQIPVTQENITQFEAYKSYEHSVLSDINTMEDGFSQLFNSMISDSGDAQSAQQSASLFDNLTEILYDGNKTESTNISDVFDNDTINRLKDIIKEAAGSQTDNSSVKQLLDKLNNNQASIHDVISGLADIIKNDRSGQTLLKNIGSDFLGRLIKEMTNETLKLNPSDVANPDGIKNYYKRIKNVMEKMSENSELSDKAGDISKSMESIKSNIDFMNDLNKNMTYFQMPLRFSQSDANGELYVFTNKKALAQGTDNVSALLHLDMENLGPVDVFVRLNKKNVSTNFCLESEELLDFVYSNIDKLNARLKALGYNTTFEMKLNSEQKDFDFVNDFVDKDIPKNKTSQYVFDVKA